MKAIKPPKRPNSNGHPLPSRFARTLYQSIRWATTIEEKRRAHLPRTLMFDFYGHPYVVGEGGEPRRAM